MLEHIEENADTRFNEYRVESSDGPRCKRSAMFKSKWNAAGYFGQRLLTGCIGKHGWVDLMGRFDGKEWYFIARYKG